MVGNEFSGVRVRVSRDHGLGTENPGNVAPKILGPWEHRSLELGNTVSWKNGYRSPLTLATTEVS